MHAPMQIRDHVRPGPGRLARPAAAGQDGLAGPVPAGPGGSFRQHRRGAREDHRDPARPAAAASRPAVPGRLGSGAAPLVRRHAGPGGHRRGPDRLRLGRHDGRLRRRTRTCSSARTPGRSPGTSGSWRPSASTRAGTGRWRPRCGTSSARPRGSRWPRCSAGRPPGFPRTRRSARPAPRRRGPRRRWPRRRPGSAPSSCGSTAGTRPPGWPRSPRSARPPGTAWRSWST